MLTKRAAIIALMANSSAKVLHADTPDSYPRVNYPTAWHVDLSHIQVMLVHFEGKTLTIAAKDIFAALQG